MIKTIVFDLGGVYFESGTDIALKKIYKIVTVPKERVDEIFERCSHTEGFLYRKGGLTKQQFWNAAIKKLKINKKTALKLQEIWHASYKVKKSMKTLVSKLRKNYRVIVFSDNIKERVEYVNKKYGLNKDFDEFIYSFEAGFNKKEIEFYKHLLRRIKCPPEEAIYIDNKQEFVRIGKSLGLNTILFKNPEQLKADLKKFGV